MSVPGSHFQSLQSSDALFGPIVFSLRQVLDIRGNYLLEAGKKMKVNLFFFFSLLNLVEVFNHHSIESTVPMLLIYATLIKVHM